MPPPLQPTAPTEPSSSSLSSPWPPRTPFHTHRSNSQHQLNAPSIPPLSHAPQQKRRRFSRDDAPSALHRSDGSIGGNSNGETRYVHRDSPLAVGRASSGRSRGYGRGSVRGPGRAAGVAGSYARPRPYAHAWEGSVGGGNGDMRQHFDRRSAAVSADGSEELSIRGSGTSANLRIGMSAGMGRGGGIVRSRNNVWVASALRRGRERQEWMSGRRSGSFGGSSRGEDGKGDEKQGEEERRTRSDNRAKEEDQVKGRNQQQKQQQQQQRQASSPSPTKTVPPLSPPSTATTKISTLAPHRPPLSPSTAVRNAPYHPHQLPQHQYPHAQPTLVASLTHEITTRTHAAAVHARRGERDKWLRNRDALAWLKARVEALRERDGDGMEDTKGKAKGKEKGGSEQSQGDRGREQGPLGAHVDERGRVVSEDDGHLDEGEWERVETPSSSFVAGSGLGSGNGRAEGQEDEDAAVSRQSKRRKKVSVAEEGERVGGGECAGGREAEGYDEEDPYMCGDAASEVEDLLDWEY